MSLDRVSMQEMMRWERATPVALFSALRHPMSATVGEGYFALVARSQRESSCIQSATA
jgi:hypothetical protein